MHLAVFILAILSWRCSEAQIVSPVFHRSFSLECDTHKIKSEANCVDEKGSDAWSTARRTSESDTRFVPITGKFEGFNKRCHSKLLVFTQHCNIARTCIMTTYRYGLQRPRSPEPFDISKCANDWFVQTACQANGPGGRNTKAVYSNCFSKGARSFCSIAFKKCKQKSCFAWNPFKKTCFAPCSNPRYEGVAIEFTRTCRECGGTKPANISQCPGGPANSIRVGRCMKKPRTFRFPECEFEKKEDAITPAPAVFTSVSSPPTTTLSSSTTTIKTSSTSPTVTRTSVTTRKTTVQTTTKPTTTTASTTRTTPPTTTTLKTRPPTTSRKTTTKKILPTGKFTTSPVYVETTSTTRTQSTTKKKTPKSTTQKSTTASTRKSKKSPATTNSQSQSMVMAPFLVPMSNNIASNPVQNNQVVVNVERDVQDTEVFNAATLAGGVGAGIIFIVLVILLVVIFMKRADSKASPTKTYSSSSLQVSKTPKNPVVHSSSFRIKSWTRRRPGLPQVTVSVSETEPSTGDYWDIDRVSEATNGNQHQLPTKPAESLIPDVVNASHQPGGSFSLDPVYDDVAGDECENIYASIKDPEKEGTFIIRSGKSSHGNAMQVPRKCTRNERPVYAVVQKNRKSPKGQKKAEFEIVGDQELEENPFRKPRGPRERTTSATTLEGRQLRDGVLKIEFDKKEGLRCKLSESNVYINLEETDPPPVQ